MYIRSTREIQELCAALAGQPLLAIDTEFVGEETYFPRLEIIQIATPALEAIVDFREASGGFAEPARLEPLWKFLASPDVELVMHDAREDSRILAHAMGRPAPNIFDTQMAYSFLDTRYQAGYLSLVGDLCGRRLDKGPQMLDWGRRPLPKEQIEYALNDVRYLLELREKLIDRLERRGRLEWYLAEQRDPQSDFSGGPDPSEAWRKVKKGGSLDGREMAILRELAAWREEQAMDEDTLARSSRRGRRSWRSRSRGW
jgi:ribonuclease D